MSVLIYTISDPRDGLVRYVGKTIDAKERFRKHLTENNKTLKCQWIKSLKKASVKAEFNIIDECLESEWEDKERFYIRLYRSMGAKLTNQMPGGEGGATMLGRKLTAEQAKKISDWHKGKPRPWLALSNVESKGYKIARYTMDDALVEVHPSMRHAAQAISRSDRRIQQMVTGTGKKVNHVGGFKFAKYIEANS